MKFWKKKKKQAAVIGEQGRVYGEQMWIVYILCNEEDNNVNQYRDRFLFYTVSLLNPHHVCMCVWRPMAFRA